MELNKQKGIKIMREMSNHLYAVIVNNEKGAFRLVDHARSKATFRYAGLESQELYKRLSKYFRTNRKLFNETIHKEIWG